MNHQNISKSKSKKKHSAFFPKEKKEHCCLGDGDNLKFQQFIFFRFEKFNPLEIKKCNVRRFHSLTLSFFQNDVRLYFHVMKMNK